MSEEKEKLVEEIDIEQEYQRPEIKTEKLMGFGAVCNGSSNGGRKDTTGAPNFCNSNRLMS